MTTDLPPRKLTIAHSPDSDDAFMFWALRQGLIDTDGFTFKHILSDIQSLNQAALEARYDISAISLHVYPYIATQYFLMNSGASVGDGYGPMILSRKAMTMDNLEGKSIAIPGSLTTAALILKMAVPGVRTEEIAFDKIIQSIKKKEVDAGLVIHEGQVTYQREGLHLVVDLGRWWKEQTGLPLPLGANVIRRELGDEIIPPAVGMIRQSIDYGLENRPDAIKYAQEFGRDLVQSEIDTFVSMYVNDFTRDLGDVGRKAVTELLKRGANAGIIPQVDLIDFV